jgi:LysR family glycine cleavage system transcriptional activator
MAQRLPPLNALRAFEVAARHNSFTGAAAELHVSHAAISRHVRALEARLGVTLFRKAKRGVALTEEGERYLRSVSAAFDGIAEATEELVGATPAQLRVSVHPAFAARWLIRRLERFSAAHPDCEVVLDSLSRVVDVARDEADLAIRRGEGYWPGAAQDLLVPSRVVPVAAPALLETGRGGLTPADIAGFKLLHDDDGSLWHSWFEAAGISRSDRPNGARILETGLAIEAALAGQGAVLADPFLIADELAAQRLVQLSDIAVADWSYYLVRPDGMRLGRTAAAFREWLLAETEPLRSAG